MANVIDSLSYDNNTYTFTLPYGVCSTAAGTLDKIVTVPNFSLETGARVAVKFTSTNTVSYPTLNVNYTGANSIHYHGAPIPANYLAINKTYEFVYNGSDWELIGDVDTNTTYTFNGAVSTIKDSNLTASRALISNDSGKVAVSNVTSTELGYLDGVTSNVQTQLDNKMPSSVSNFELNNSGSLKGYGGFIDFHYYNSSGAPLNASGTEVSATPDYTSRIIENAAGQIDVNGVKMKSGSIINPTGSGYVSIGRKDGTTAGTQSIAMGNNATASGPYSIAIGNQLTTSGESSISTGYGTNASGECATSMGSITTASGKYSFAIGYNSTASGFNSNVIGYNSTASGEYSAAFGVRSTALNAQVVLGHDNNTTNATAGTTWGTSSGTAFVIGNGSGSSSTSNAFRVNYTGQTYGKSSYTTSGCDYAEYFEWLDSNPDNEDRRGYFVTLDGEKIKIAEPGDYILGIISGRPAVIGNGDEDWMGRYVLDDFGEFIYEDYEYEDEEPEEAIDEETGEITIQMKTVKKTCKKYKENPDYDPSIAYIQREDRPEWDAVGMVGVLSVRDDGTCQVNGYCKVAEGGTATASDSGYRVVKRVTDNIVKVIFRG